MSQSNVHLFYSDHRGVEQHHRLVTALVAAEAIARATYDGLNEEAVNDLTWSLENETSGYTIGLESGGTLTALPSSSPHLTKAYGPAASSPFEVIAEGVYDEASDTLHGAHVAATRLGYALPAHPDCPACQA